MVERILAMEIIKEVRVDRLNTECTEQSSFHVNIVGLQDSLPRGKKFKVRTYGANS